VRISNVVVKALQVRLWTGCCAFGQRPWASRSHTFLCDRAV